MDGCPSCSGAAFSTGDRSCNCRIVPLNEFIDIEGIPNGYAIGGVLQTGVDIDGNTHELGVDTIVEGAVNAKTGAPIPTDGNGNLLITDLNPAAYPYTCPITTQNPVWCDNAGRLYTEKPYKSLIQASNSADNIPIGPLVPGTRYRKVSLSAVNNDPCGRVLDCCIDFLWSGWAADFPAGASGVMAYYVATFIAGQPGLSNLTSSGEVNATSSGRQFFDGTEVRQCFQLQPGEDRSFEIGMLFTQGIGVGDPVPSNFSSSGIYATRIRLECESV